MKRMRKLQHELLQESIKGEELPKILWEIFGVLVKSVQRSLAVDAHEVRCEEGG